MWLCNQFDKLVYQSFHPILLVFIVYDCRQWRLSKFTIFYGFILSPEYVIYCKIYKSDQQMVQLLSGHYLGSDLQWNGMSVFYTEPSKWRSHPKIESQIGGHQWHHHICQGLGGVHGCKLPPSPTLLNQLNMVPYSGSWHCAWECEVMALGGDGAGTPMVMLCHATAVLHFYALRNQPIKVYAVGPFKYCISHIT